MWMVAKWFCVNRFYLFKLKIWLTLSFIRIETRILKSIVFDFEMVEIQLLIKFCFNLERT